MSNAHPLPAHGASREDVLARMRQLRAGDARWREGRTWAFVYHAGDELKRLLADAYTEFMAENGLSPIAFPSLKKFEAEVLAMSASLFHGTPETAGTMTSGGSESLLMAVKTARDHARAEKGITEPEAIFPITCHPALDKAAHYFGVKALHAPVDDSFRVDVKAVERLITPNTILLVGSAPAYPHGVIDPIPELAALARRHGLLCHVDACLGGFHLPFARKLGVEVPPFDFQVEGVTSLSADIHKYGFAAKGASVILYKDKALRRHQFFTRSDWPGGLYGSPSMLGTRPGGAIAAAWAVMNHLGEEGYLRIHKTILDTADKLRAGIRAIPGLRVLGDARYAIFAFGSDSLDIYALGDAMEARGWKLNRQMEPPALHCMVTPTHEPIADLFLEDLRECAGSLARGEPAPEGSAAMYGMLGQLPDRTLVDGFILDFMDGLLELEG
jgi:sphinganine-1-phosphate aldolase